MKTIHFKWGILLCGFSFLIIWYVLRTAVHRKELNDCAEFIHNTHLYLHICLNPTIKVAYQSLQKQIIKDFHNERRICEWEKSQYVSNVLRIHRIRRQIYNVNVLCSTYLSFDLNEHYLNIRQRRIRWWHRCRKRWWHSASLLRLVWIRIFPFATNFRVVALNRNVNIYSFTLEQYKRQIIVRLILLFAQWSEMKTLW